MQDVEHMRLKISKAFDYLNTAKKEIDEAVILLQNLKIDKSQEKGSLISDYITKEDFLLILDISESTYWRWKKGKRFKDKVLGKGKVFIHKSELEKLLKNAA